ncbi:MAG: 2OG-Fe(II) oxygenase [Proteobacteria bacterium]|nr:2OG-Fe(II) oxygenase [Pseudomonadota bacterium]
MAGNRSAPKVEVGDWMPRITLPVAGGGLFDSFDATACGRVRVYWLGVLSDGAASLLSDALAVQDADLIVVTALPVAGHATTLVDRAGDFAAAFGVAPPAAVVVDPADRVAAVLAPPGVAAVLGEVARLHDASTPHLVQAQAPVLMLERVVEPPLRRALLDYWRGRDKLANRVGTAGGNVVNSDVKRRLDVEVDEPGLLARLREDIGRRVVPAVLRAFQIGVMVIEAPIVGCYDADEGGRFGRHRDNTSSLTAHRQFALSINLNPDDEYQGGEVWFPEFGRELYRPPAGAALVFSTALLHEVLPVRQGRRYGVFSFLSSRAPGVVKGPSLRSG